MKKQLSILIFILFFCVSSSAAKVRSSLNLVTLDNSAPYTWQENGQARGMDIDVVLELCKRVQVECGITFYPWSRVLSKLQSGDADGGFAGFKTPEREKYSHYLEFPLHWSTYSVFVKKGYEFPFESIQDLYGKRIGINRGYAIYNHFKKAESEGKIIIENADHVNSNLKILLRGRIDGFVTNRIEGLFSAKKLGLSGKITTLPTPVIESRGAYLLFSKKAGLSNNQLIPKMNEVLKKMWEEGTVNKIQSKYIK